MANQCSICGENGVLYMAEYTAENGEKVKEVMCYKCITAIRKSGRMCQIAYVANGSGMCKATNSASPNLKNETDAKPSGPVVQSATFQSSNMSLFEKVAETDWTKIFKASNMVLLAISVISGMIGGTVLLIEEGWEFFGFLVGAPLGALAGFLAGIVTVSFAMVIVEISQKLSDIRDSQREQNELTQKLIDILEDKNKNEK